MWTPRSGSGRFIPICLSVCLLTASFLPVDSVWAVPAPRRLPPARKDADPLNDRWLTVRLPQFTLYTNGRQRVAEMVCRNMLALHGAIFGMNPHLEPKFETPTYVLAFNDYDSFYPYQVDRAGRPLNIAGMFLPSPITNYIVLVADPNYEPYPVVYHEYAHHLLRSVFPNIPDWLDEGLAEYYSSLWVFPDRVEIGGSIKHHAALLKKGRLMSLETLLGEDEIASKHANLNLTSLFYAQSWALVHLLLRDDPTRLDRFVRYVELLEQGTSSEAAFIHTFGTGLEDMLARLRAYGKAGKYKAVKLEGLRIGGGKALSIAAARPEEILAHLGEYLLLGEIGRTGKAEEHLRSALATSPSHPRATSSLAYLKSREGEHDEAEALYEKILTTAPDDEHARLLYGLTLIDRYDTGRGFDGAHVVPSNSGGGLHPDLARARQHLETAMRLNPRRAETYVSFGYTFAEDPGDVGEGVEALQKAREMFPRRDDVAFYLALLLDRQDDLEGAIALFEQVRASGRDPELVDLAEKNLVHLTLHRADEMSADGRMEEARQLVASFRESLIDKGLQATLDEYLHELEAMNGINVRLGAAEGLARQGRFEEATAMLKQLCEEADDEDLKQMLHQQIAEIEELANVAKRIYEAQTLLAEGDLREGAAVLRQARRQTGDPGVIAFIDGEIERIEKLEAQSRRDLDVQQEALRNVELAVGLYEAGRAALQSSQLDLAESRFQEALEHDLPPEVEEHIRELVELIRKQRIENENWRARQSQSSKPPPE